MVESTLWIWKFPVPASLATIIGSVLEFYLVGYNEASIKNPPVTMAKTAARMYIVKSEMKIGYLHDRHPIFYSNSIWWYYVLDTSFF